MTNQHLAQIRGLNAQARLALGQIESLSAPFVWAADTGEMTRIAIARATHAAVSQALVGKAPPVEESVDLHIPGDGGHAIPVRLSIPRDPCPGAIVYLHGGGWVVGTLNTYDRLCRELANRSRMRVIAVDYRLAPEHPYPAAIEDTLAALRWVACGAAPEIPRDQPLIVAGDSAGGNLAASACIRSAQTDGPAIAAQVLIYPITDVTMTMRSYRDFGDGLYLTHAAMKWYWQSYLQDRLSIGRHDASVFHSKLGKGPPALVITAEFDPLRDEGEAFANRLASAGTPVTLRRFEGMMHGFVRFADVIDAAHNALDLAASFIQDAVGPEKSFQDGQFRLHEY